MLLRALAALPHQQQQQLVVVVVVLVHLPAVQLVLGQLRSRVALQVQQYGAVVAAAEAVQVQGMRWVQQYEAMATAVQVQESWRSACTRWKQLQTLRSISSRKEKGRWIAYRQQHTRR